MSPELRSAIYAVVATLLGLFAILGWVLPGGPDAWLAALNTVLDLVGIFSLLLAKKNVPIEPSKAKHLDPGEFG